MKIKMKKASWEEVLAKPAIPHLKPLAPPFLFRLLVRVLSIPDLLKVKFSYVKEGMERAGEGPYLILMNHSSFLDLKMASKVLFPMPYNIVSTTDTFVGKALLMRLVGCIPTQKFVTDVNLVMDMIRIVKKQKRSILMYPEAGYTFDGTATTLPRKLGGMCKRLGVPVLMLRSDEGGFLRDPLYNGLRLRRVQVGATLSCLFNREDLKEMTVEELDARIDEAFSFDHFAAQKEKGVSVTEKTRATGLERVLYRCPHCERDGVMKGEGIYLSCTACGKEYQLLSDGSLQEKGGDTAFSHVPSWYAWERACVKKELEEGTYRLEVPVKVGVICDHRAMYMVGEGTLIHDRSGFTLKRENGEVVYTQDPYASYGLNADFFFYEIGDMISIGDKKRLYYCFPQIPVPVTRARLAAEEMYHMPKLS